MRIVTAIMSGSLQKRALVNYEGELSKWDENYKKAISYLVKVEQTKELFSSFIQETFGNNYKRLVKYLYNFIIPSKVLNWISCEIKDLRIRNDVFEKIAWLDLDQCRIIWACIKLKKMKKFTFSPYRYYGFFKHYHQIVFS